MSETNGQTTESQQVSEKWLQFENLYVAGAYRELTRFHIYDDCYHIKQSKSDPRPTSINAIKFHSLEPCTNCKKRAISYITSPRREQPPTSSLSIQLKPQERKQLDALVSSHIIKDRTTGVRASLYELHQMVRDEAVPVQFGLDDNGSEQIDHSQRVVVYADVYAEDIRLADKLVEKHGFTTPNEVYRTAIVLYINSLSELDLAGAIEQIDMEVDTDAADLDIGVSDQNGMKPVGKMSVTPIEDSTDQRYTPQSD